jgi:hypothetical protein
MATLQITKSVSGLGVNQQVVISKTATGIVLLDGETCATGQTDKQFTGFEVDQSAMNFLWIYSDQTITIETNNGAAPTDTIAVTATVPIEWQSGMLQSNPITGDITGNIYVTNSSGATATITIIIGQDPTP